MIIDLQNKFSAAQALTVTAYATNVIDLSEARNIADGDELGVMVTVDVAADHDDGDETYEIDIETGTTTGLGTIVDTHKVLFSALTLGARLFFPLPVGVDLKQFLGLHYILGETTPSVTLSAELIPQSFVDKQKTYKAGYVIL